jgi:type II secretory pathway pseudopilin PulG
LVETVLYVAIVGAVAVAFVTFGLTVSDSRAKADALAEVQANGRLALELIAREVRAASDVNLGASTFDLDPGVLSLATVDGATNPTVIDLDQDDGRLRLRAGAGAPVFVTSARVRVSRLVFTNLTGGSARPHVRIELTVDSLASTPAARASAAFTTAASVRQ